MTATALCRDCLWTGAPVRRCPSCASPRVLVHDELEGLSIAHMDCDAFYASVEKRDRPELRDVPVIVGGGVRGVVTTACYIARTFGVRSAMPMFKARKLCPDAVIIKPDFSKYKAASAHIMAKLRSLTPLVQPLSLDEAWIDLSGTARLNGGSPAWQLARAQGEIEAEIGLTVSVGLAASKFLAKIASDLDKPRGFAVIGAREAVSFLASRPVSLLPGVGPALNASLAKSGYRTIGDIGSADPKTLVARYGEYGLRLFQLANAQDTRPVNPDHDRKSISAETTFNTDIASREALENELWPLCERVARRIRQEGSAGSVVTLKLKTADFRSLTRRRSVSPPIQTAKELFAVAKELLAGEANGARYRLIGAGLSNLVEAGDAPSDLFGDAAGKALKGEKAMDALRDKYGAGVIVSGRALKGKDGAR